MHPGKKMLEDYLGQGKSVAYDNVTAENDPPSDPKDVFKKLFPTTKDDEDEDKDKKVG